MDILTVVFGAGLLVYTAIYTYRQLELIRKYKAANNSGLVTEHEGTVKRTINETKKKLLRSVVTTCYPEYKTIINNKEYVYVSPVRRSDVEL